MLRELTYIYPMYARVSFHGIAKRHIEQLRKWVTVQEVDENVLDNIQWVTKKRILVHPALYPLVGVNIWTYQRKIHRLPRLKAVSELLGGFEVADTNRIGEVAVKVLNEFDVVFVPSTFCVEVLKDSGVETPVELLPHGLHPDLLKDDYSITNDTCLRLLKMKQERGFKFVLYFLLHSGFRKGAHVLKKAMQKIQEKRDDIILVVKRENLVDPFMHELRKLRMVEVAGWFPMDGIRQLYDVCDLTVVPSLGGGFELNALESVARGKPAITPEEGCFKDYLEHVVPVKVERWVKVFHDNIVHVGKGHEVSVDDLANKIIEVVDHYDEYKEKAEESKDVIRERYNWERIGKMLRDYLEKHGFLS